MRSYINIKDFTEEEYALLKSKVKSIEGGVLINGKTKQKIEFTHLPNLKQWISEQKAKLINATNKREAESLLSETQYVHIPNSTGVEGRGANYSTAIWFKVIQRYNNSEVDTLTVCKLLRGLHVLQHNKSKLTAEKINILVNYVKFSGLNSDFTDRFMSAIEQLTIGR